VVVALTLCAPRAVVAKPIGTFDFLVADPGDQTSPSIDGQFVVYSGPAAAGGLDVLLYDTQRWTSQVIAGGAGDQADPDVSFSTAVYRAPDGIWIEFWQTNTPLRRPPSGGDGAVSAPSIGSGVAAWEIGVAGERDVRVNRWGELREETIPAPGAPGDQRAPSAHGDLVAYLDGAAPGAPLEERDAVWLYDSGTGELTRVCSGVATGVSVGSEGAETFVAVARSTELHDQDVEVWDPSGGAAPLAALRVPGVQRNPHLSGPWVAFEDVSTAYSQVIVWNWRTGLVFVPHPSETHQLLNDLTLLAGEEVRVVFEDSLSADTGRDIALYALDVNPLQDDGLPNGYPFETEPPPAEPATCDGGATPLATLELGRTEGAPLAGEVAFRGELPEGAKRLPVLVCIDADRVSAAWVALDDEAIARPCDFNPAVIHLEVLGHADGGAGRISGVIAGKPGAGITVRVFADPARLAEGFPAKGDLPAAAARLGGGCASAGGGAASLLALALVFARRRARRG
jgi:hypothetical protein